MRALIVGCGYVGLPLGAELVRRGHEVFGIRRSAESQELLKSVGVELIAADITRREQMERLPAEYDWVIHCVSTSGGGVEDYRAVYLEGTRNLLDCLKQTPVRNFVYTGSTSVYGQTDGSAVDEKSLTEPASATARVLVETEGLLLRAASEANFPVVVLRLAGIYGPGRGYWLKQFLSGEARLEGRGERILNMIHRDDVVGAILAAIDRGRSGEIYNVVDNEPVRQVDLFGWISCALSRPMPPALPKENETSRQRGITHKRVLNRKLRTELDYQLKFPTFREGCAAELRLLRPSAD